MVEFAHRHAATAQALCPSSTNPQGVITFHDRTTGDEISTDHAFDFAHTTLTVDAWQLYPALERALSSAGAGVFRSRSGFAVPASWIREVAGLFAAGKASDVLDLVLGPARPVDADLYASITCCADDTVILSWDSRACGIRRFLFLRPSTGDVSCRPGAARSLHGGTADRSIFAVHGQRYTNKVFS